MEVLLKLITLNTWGGRAMQSLMNFFRDYRDSVDIFCLQEIHDTTQNYVERTFTDEFVRWDVWQKIRRATPEFTGYFARFDDNRHRMSVAMLVRNGISVDYSGDMTIYHPEKIVEKGTTFNSPRKVQFVILRDGESALAIANYHGLWIPAGKQDTPERLQQSAALNHMFRQSDLPVIFCADMNLEPQTGSMKILENGMRNLITEFGITSTRTALYRDFNNPTESKYADYILIKSGIEVNDFKVMPDLCSDHAPLYLDFEV